MDECFNCGQPGHWQSQCPATVKASNRDEHLARIDELVARWRVGDISIEQKRRAISAENQLYYGPDCRRPLIYP